MIKLKFFHFLPALTVLLGSVICIHLLVPVYPAFTLPAIPDLFGVAVFSGILAFVFAYQRHLLVSNIFFLNHEIILLGLIWLNTLVLIAPRAIISLFKTPNQAWIPCREIPGFATKIECLLQASVAQHYGIRNFFILLCGVTLGTLSFILARTVRHAWKIQLGAVVFGACLVVVTGFLGRFLGISQVLPKSLVYNPYGVSYMTQIFDNPGPVWTYIAPGLAVVLWLAFSDLNLIRKFIWSALCCLLIVGIFATTQRGGFVLCFSYIAICGLYAFLKGIKKKNIPILMFGGLIISILGFTFWSLLKNPLLIYQLTQSVGYNWKPANIFLDPARFKLVRVAWKMFQDSPLFGHGYASWYQLVSEYSQFYDVTVYHSTHNWFVQLFVEFGVLHTILMLGLVFATFCTFFSIQKKTYFIDRKVELLILLSLFSFLIPSVLGNLDDIRPVFYTQTIFFTTVFGISVTNLPKKQTIFVLNKRIISQLINKNRFNLLSNIFCILTGLLLLAILFCALSFTKHGSAFDANTSNRTGMISRWLGQSVELAVFKTPEGKPYSISQLTPFKTPMAIDIKKDRSSFEITVNPDEQISLALENGRRWIPRKHPITFSEGMPDTSRWISAMVYYPFLQSNLGVSWSRGMYWWENLGGRLGRWCTGDCWFLAKSCGVQNRLDFSILSPRPDLTTTQPLPVTLSAYSLPVGGEFSSQTLSNLPQPLMQQKLQLKTPEERQTVGVVGTPDTAWYLVHAQTDSIFNPQVQGFSTDNRDLGVMIAEPDCG
ncbi:O-antigen ligase family protein [Spirulina subsalsa FACHB-351]|uniref:O-antigen ligase family protein n=1 Tax=Spirulina subsalsa FACHB-351 TaxID=234711 RepID=A0ABT3L708_9CYAN|nr:O-antigen ligase family protein [Spirulina subsalsa]MCW6037297.1 O-antigen ligase family protein [Spirulina subsalsa FACHB-351]